MSPSPQSSADAASDAYKDRPQSDIDSQRKPVYLNGHEYTVFGYKDDPRTGFHATAYRSKETGEVIIAYRGTDPDFKNHPGTMAQDIAVDATMVRDQINPQEPAASAFTQEMLDKAKALGIPQEQVTLAGHSLGGTVVEIEAAKFPLRGITLNAFGAVGLLGYNVPEGRHEVTNYVMAGDVVSAASHHYGTVVPLASNEDIQRLKVARYLDAPPGALPPNPLLATSLRDHSGGHFTGPNSVLAPRKLSQYMARHEQNRAATSMRAGHKRAQQVLQGTRAPRLTSSRTTFSRRNCGSGPRPCAYA